MSNTGGWDPFQDDWGTGNEERDDSSTSDFDFKWDPDNDFTQVKDRKASPIAWVQRQRPLTKILAAAGAFSLVAFIFVQAGGITRLQMMGIFRESISPAAACLNSGQVMVDLGIGTMNNLLMNKALERADRLRSQRSGDPAVDEAMWSVADSVYKANDAAESVTFRFSFGDLMAGDILDRLQNPEVIAAAESLNNATTLWAGACEQLGGSSLDVLTSPQETPNPILPTESAPPAPTLATTTDIFAAPPDLQGFIRQTQNATLEVFCLPNPNSSEGDAGSGFLSDVSILTGDESANVVIVTNHHVIEQCVDEGEIQVTLGERTARAVLLGSDVRNDLAILRASDIAGGAITPSRVIEVGQWVMASGFPQDVGQAVTFGQVTGRDPQDGWITSDALVGPGNSGGPLVNSNGEVVGVVGAVFIRVEGISASVPIERLCENLIVCK